MSEFSFEESYFKETYQGQYFLRNPDHKWITFLKRILNNRKTGDLLDIGCAYGAFLKHASKYFSCSGCDISNHALEYARSTLPENILLFRGALGEISCSQKFDVITCFDVLEHVSDLDVSWKNISALLNPGGIVVITLPVYDGPLGRLVMRIDQDQSHIHRCGRSFWLGQVQANYKLVEYSGVWRYFFFSKFYINFISLWTRSISPAILIIAENHNDTQKV